MTPLISAEEIRLLLREAVKQVSIASRFLEDWFIILCKKDTGRYFLPQNHIQTTAVYLNRRLFPIIEREAILLSVTTPTYYTEDDWQDEASQAGPSEFVIHMSLLSYLWPLQLMRSQRGFGRKVITIISPPTEDGEIPPSAPMAGMLDGLFELSDDFHWPEYTGVVYQLPSTNKNLVVFCRVLDKEPTFDDTVYNDALALLYMCKTLSLALAREDDESDNIRSLIYDEVARAGSQLLRNCYGGTE
ncbi:MAG: hypothetical protein K6T85_01715 [Gorillibacterium sp.]|nr:hypothetical protein [Gorillibacterium sp.]